MKKFNIIFIITLLVIAASFISANLLIHSRSESGRPYRVEIKRLADEITAGKETDLSACEYVTGITLYAGQEDFYDTDSEYTIKNIDGNLYRFDYTKDTSAENKKALAVNLSLAVLSLFIIIIMVYIRTKIISPFNKLSDVPYELSKGKLTNPLEENKSRFFGRFVWGVNMLRDNINDQKEKELRLLAERQTLVLSISHDIKTPLSAIKLYSKAMSKGLYTDKEKLTEAASGIERNANDIEKFVNDLMKSAGSDFMQLEVNNSEVYLSVILNEIKRHYIPRLADSHTEFSVSDYIDCLLLCDPDRSREVLKNLMDNAIKYGDGKYVRIEISEEDGCRLVCVANSGCTLPPEEMLHIFDSFWRGSNAEKKSGSGLGLYICRQLMLKMNGDIFAEQKDGEMRLTAVFPKA